MEPLAAIVTGGAQGIGAAICVMLIKEGYRVCVSDINEEKGKQFVAEQQKKYGTDKVKFITCDVSKEDDYKELFDFALNEFGRLDLVVNNAGTGGENRKVIEVNLMGPITGCRLAFEYMGKSNGGKGGMVINTASATGLMAYAPSPIYAASKHGVVGLTRSYGTHHYWEKDGILFAAICPLYVDTDLIRDRWSELEPFESFMCMERMCPEYVAEGVLKLLKDRINGSILLVSKEKGFLYVGIAQEMEDA